jgi:glycerophosphoryl diester phosphodiesterase
MPPRTGFDVQGHRGARGLRPENTLPGFELALDLGVSSIETDLHLTSDGVPVLLHDAVLPTAGGPRPVSGLTHVELRAYRVDGNPHALHFTEQRADVGPLARRFADERGIDPYSIPTLAELFAFVADYAGEPGRFAGKTADQRRRARCVILDLELKRVPFRPEAIGDRAEGALERRVVEEVEQTGVLDRTRARSFDHRIVRLMGELRPGLPTAVLIANTAPVRPAELVQAAGAAMYCPDYLFVDAEVVRQVHDAGQTIVPWTVNQPDEWERLLSWDVDGMTTDFPDRLLGWLRQRGVPVAGDHPPAGVSRYGPA